jgi:hypothetical protein
VDITDDITDFNITHAAKAKWSEAQTVYTKRLAPAATPPEKYGFMGTGDSKLLFGCRVKVFIF